MKKILTTAILAAAMLAAGGAVLIPVVKSGARMSTAVERKSAIQPSIDAPTQSMLANSLL